MQYILIADDNSDITDVLATYAKKEELEPLIAADGMEAIRLFKQYNPSVVLLDVMMPKEDGYEVCRKIRAMSDEPVIIITARGEHYEKIMGLDIGADDYIVKPFDMDELGARVAAHLRRENRRQERSVLRFFADMVIDYSRREVTIRGEMIPLSRKEFDIVELLSVNAGQVFDRERIYERVWGYDGDGNSDTVMEHIRKIRAKFAAASLHSYIETVWGVGYKWNG